MQTKNVAFSLQPSKILFLLVFLYILYQIMIILSYRNVFLWF